MSQPQQSQAQQPVRQQASPTVPTPPKADVAPSPDPGCEDRRDNRKSDLCAQWKAADAAFQAAGAAREQVLASWIGVILGGVTMGAAIAAATFAKAAADQTRRGADAAEKSIQDSTQIAHHELRAYINSDSESVLPATDTEPQRLQVVLRNAGSTPAYNLIAHGRFFSESHDGVKGRISVRDWQVGTLARDSTTHLTLQFSVGLQEREMIDAGEGFISYAIEACFSDAFGVRWRYIHDMKVTAQSFVTGYIYTIDVRQERT